MHRLLLIPALWLVTALTAHGLSVELPVTASNQAQYHLSFSIATNAASDGIAFHLTITNKTGDIFPDSSAYMAMVIHDKENRSRSISPAEPPIPVTLKKAPRVWTADFTISNKQLQQPGLCFVFGELAHGTINGKLIAMPSIDFYELKLLEFSKP